MKQILTVLLVLILCCAAAVGCARADNQTAGGEKIVIPAREQPYIPLVTLNLGGRETTVQTAEFSSRILTWFQAETAEQLPYENTPEDALIVRIQVTPEEEQQFFVWQKDNATLFSSVPPGSEDIDKETTFIYRVSENCYVQILTKIV